MKKVLVTGTFDFLHKGHLDFFRQALEHGETLVVVVARDETVEKVKREPAWHDEKKRLKQVQNCEFVSKAVLGSLGDKYNVIEDERPDVICLGYDQEAFTDKLEEEMKKRGLNVEIIRLKPHIPEKFKTSKIKENLLKDDDLVLE